MASNNLFSMLKGRLRNAEKDLPSVSCLVMGFNKSDLPKNPNPLLLLNKNFLNGLGDKAHLLWFDVNTKTFYDQGLAKKMKPAAYSTMNATNYNSTKPTTSIQYYIPIDHEVVNETVNMDKKHS